MATELTPCSALFETMKRYGGISHKDLARLVLSGRPLADGKSPLSRCDDRTWVSASSCMPLWARCRTATFAIGAWQLCAFRRACAPATGRACRPRKRCRWSRTRAGRLWSRRCVNATRTWRCIATCWSA